MTDESDAQEESQRSRWHVPPAVYVLSNCPTGCGDLVALRALPSRSLMLYCDSCGCGFRTVGDYDCEFPSALAPEGIEFPSMGEVRAAFPSEPVSARSSRASAFWELIAQTRLAAGDASSALAIAQEVLDTWYHPPKRAVELRERARRAMDAAGG